MARIGVLLSGCGRYDGTEIHEAVLAVLALDRRGARAEFLAPSSVRAETVDHASGQIVEGELRAVLTEAARLARGRIVPLPEARSSLLGGLVIPGGQGIARNLMRGVAEPGRRREVEPEVAELLRSMIEQRKPIGAISLGGSLVSTMLGLPLDEDPFSTPPSEIRVDGERGIVWTPGFLSGDRISEIAVGIDRMVEEVLKRVSKALEVLQ
jgi:enhancing lycopene biosynthesis protein 2